MATTNPNPALFLLYWEWIQFFTGCLQITLSAATVKQCFYKWKRTKNHFVSGILRCYVPSIFTVVGVPFVGWAIIIDEGMTGCVDNVGIKELGAVVGKRNAEKVMLLDIEVDVERDKLCVDKIGFWSMVSMVALVEGDWDVRDTSASSAGDNETDTIVDGENVELGDNSSVETVVCNSKGDELRDVLNTEVEVAVSRDEFETRETIGVIMPDEENDVDSPVKGPRDELDGVTTIPSDGDDWGELIKSDTDVNASNEGVTSREDVSGRAVVAWSISVKDDISGSDWDSLINTGVVVGVISLESAPCDSRKLVVVEDIVTLVVVVSEDMDGESDNSVDRKKVSVDWVVKLIVADALRETNAVKVNSTDDRYTVDWVSNTVNEAAVVLSDDSWSDGASGVDELNDPLIGSDVSIVVNDSDCDVEPLEREGGDEIVILVKSKEADADCENVDVMNVSNVEDASSKAEALDEVTGDADVSMSKEDTNSSVAPGVTGKDWLDERDWPTEWDLVIEMDSLAGVKERDSMAGGDDVANLLFVKVARKSKLETICSRENEAGASVWDVPMEAENEGLTKGSLRKGGIDTEALFEEETELKLNVWDTLRERDSLVDTESVNEAFTILSEKEIKKGMNCRSCMQSLCCVQKFGCEYLELKAIFSPNISHRALR